MSKKTYGELLRDPRWQKRRLEIMERAKWACEECGDTGTTFNVHHKLYRKGAMPWEYTNAELACLCENCHKTETMTRAALMAALSELDSYELQELLGFAEGIIAKGKVFSDCEREENPHVETTWPIRSLGHARGFLVAVWARCWPIQAEQALAGGSLGFDDIYCLSADGYDEAAAAAQHKAAGR